VGLAVLPATFLRLSAIYVELGLKNRARRARVVSIFLVCALVVLLARMFGTLAGAVFFAGGIILLFSLFDMFRRARVLHREWWFDPDVEEAHAWTELIVFGDSRTLVRTGEGRRETFRLRPDAVEWLEESGFVRADDALAEGYAAPAPD
jgi:hypothetical protein